MAQPLYVAFVWHMHQPYYRDLASGACALPWVRLHATKDYLDMVQRLEAFPQIHQTFNIVPSLIDQLEEYLPPAAHSDQFLALSQKPAAELTGEEQRFILEWFFLANGESMIRPHPRYHDLLAKRGWVLAEDAWPHIQQRFHVQDYLDLQVWFNLVWIDPWLRSQDAELARLESKGGQFTEPEKRYVLERHLAMIASVIPTYRAAAERGQIELTTSPYYHPIMPLLCDLRSAHVALPDLPLPPASFRHPEDARWHLQQGLLRHLETFGTPAQGIWPPEGSISEEVVRLALTSQLRWMATDEEILWRTLKTHPSRSALHRPHLVERPEGRLALIFRDRELSDLIGFTYSRWDPRNAAHDFLQRLGRIADEFKTEDRPGLVSIILDGENAWEAYARDGHDFFMELYGALAKDERFRCVTVSEFLQQHPLDQQAPSLPALFSGSWIDANFATWIGHPEKNAAWTLLAQGRDALTPIPRDSDAGRQAWKSLGIAEGSDWMWWFGDTHFTAQAAEFDRLFRTHLSNSYRFAGLSVPEALSVPIKRSASPAQHRPPTGAVRVTVDGYETSYYEWLYAGLYPLRQQYAAIQRGAQCLQALHYGFDDLAQYLRLDIDAPALQALVPWVIELACSGGPTIRIITDAAGTRAELTSAPDTPIPCALGHLIEVAIPKQVLGAAASERLQLAVTLRQPDGEALERYPLQGAFELLTSLATLDAPEWSV